MASRQYHWLPGHYFLSTLCYAKVLRDLVTVEGYDLDDEVGNPVKTCCALSSSNWTSSQVINIFGFTLSGWK